MKDRKLLFSVTRKDFTVQTFRSGGKGGQNQNKRDTGVRIIHKASGARGESRSHRNQYQNKQTAFDRLINDPKFKIWINYMVSEVTTGKTVEEFVDEQMDFSNIRAEVKDNRGKWAQKSMEDDWG